MRSERKQTNANNTMQEKRQKEAILCKPTPAERHRRRVFVFG